jgi:hypothetical protein
MGRLGGKRERVSEGSSGGRREDYVAWKPEGPTQVKKVGQRPITRNYRCEGVVVVVVEVVFFCTGVVVVVVVSVCFI